MEPKMWLVCHCKDVSLGVANLEHPKSIQTPKVYKRMVLSVMLRQLTLIFTTIQPKKKKSGYRNTVQYPSNTSSNVEQSL